ncbi:MAG: GH92 family glycosyl hydrolase [Bacteroidetes bacterium]|nr:GH92 family glycosyl hydrolase [Bacteroidota bacterium]
MFCRFGEGMLVTWLSLFLTVSISLAQKNDVATYVNPMIGTAAHGHVFPGATMPFGMVQLSPDEETTGGDWCSGYNYSSTSIMGFSHTHLSGTGAMDYGDILFMPTVGKVQVVPGTSADPYEGYRSPFSHSTEIASPGFYSVLLQRYDIRVNLTATDRCGMHKYIFPKSDSSNVIIDLQHGIGNTCTGGWVKIVGDRWVEGMRRSHGWADLRYVYFAAEFSKPFRSFGTAEGDVITQGGRRAEGDSVKAYVSFVTKKGEAIIIRVGISAVSLEGAKKNLAAEMPDFNFDKYRMAARRAWDRELGKIRVEGGTHAEMITFYTALYHTMIAPNIFQDVDGKYFGTDHKIHTARGFTNYTTFSLWDVFRAEFPLMTILDPKLDENFVRSLVEEYREDGFLPMWPLWGNETYGMIGYPAASVIFDAYMKGLRHFNVDTAFAAMKHSADLDWQGLKYYKDRGYIPADKEDASVSKTLEYAYEDWCIAQMAKKLGKTDDYRKFNYRSMFYENVFDSADGFMQGKMSDDRWTTPFDPFAFEGEYTEANAWQYIFFVPQDIGGLIKLFGGKKKFASKLDALFSAPSQVTAIEKNYGITGMIGQDAQGNEQSHHVPYLYDYAEQPWKTQHMVREIMAELYTDKPDGLCGNDDCGQMSAWYVFSAMGFYPVTPGQNTYAIGSPLFRKIMIRLGDGKRFVIEANRASDEYKYIQSATLDGKAYDHAYLTQSDVADGSVLHLVMSNTPNKKWGVNNPGLFAMAPDHEVVPMVSVHCNSETFYDTTTVDLSCPLRNVRIHYTLNGAEPQSNSMLYMKPIIIQKTCVLKAAAYLNNKRSMTTVARFVKSKSLYPPAVYAHPFSYRYTGGGPLALTDGDTGTTDYRAKEWQGFEGVDLDAVINLVKERKINEVSTGFLQDTDAWIFLPEHVEYYVSQDGKRFKKVAEIKNDIDPRKPGTLIKHFTADLKGVEAKYLRVFAKNMRVCPPWHPGAGGKAWLFVDEVSIRPQNHKALQIVAPSH